MNQPNGSVICSYIISGPDTFSDEFAREARGITFDAEGNVIGRPLHKFHNVNEKEHTLAHVLKGRKIMRLMDKRDGSMIHTVWLNGEVALKSKKSFESDVAKAATDWLNKDVNCLWRGFARRIAKEGKTAIFEWTSPKARIVVSYPEDQLKLLHVRDNTTGVYSNPTELAQLSMAYGIDLVDEIKLCTIDELLARAEVEEGLEGWIAQFENGEMVKVKTKWYMDRHHAMTFLRVRDIARMVIDESIDDLKAKLVGDGLDIAPIVAVEWEVMTDLRLIADEMNRLFMSVKDLSRIEAVNKYREHPHFKIAMRMYTDHSYDSYQDVLKYFEQNLLSSYSLENINLLDSVAEED